MFDNDIFNLYFDSFKSVLKFSVDLHSYMWCAIFVLMLNTNYRLITYTCIPFSGSRARDWSYKVKEFFNKRGVCFYKSSGTQACLSKHVSEEASWVSKPYTYTVACCGNKSYIICFICINPFSTGTSFRRQTSRDGPPLKQLKCIMVVDP